MIYICKRIKGTPYGKKKVRGDVGAPPKWTDAVVRQTRRLPKVDGPCMLRVTFLLPPDKFPADLSYGSDVDNLLKRFLDALGKTVFKNALGGDSCVMSLEVSKTRVEPPAAPGAQLEILPFDVS